MVYLPHMVMSNGRGKQPVQNDSEYVRRGRPMGNDYTEWITLGWRSDHRDMIKQRPNDATVDEVNIVIDLCNVY